MDYPVFRSDRIRQAGIERRRRRKRERFDFIDRVLAHVKEVQYHLGIRTTTRRRSAQVFLTSLAMEEGPGAMAELFGLSARVADHAFRDAPAIIMEVIRSGVLGEVEGWGLEVVAECERRLTPGGGDRSGKSR